MTVRVWLGLLNGFVSKWNLAVGTLQAECDRLSTALSEAEREQKSLRAVSEDVAQRLDGSIDELNRLLEG